MLEKNPHGTYYLVLPPQDRIDHHIQPPKLRKYNEIDPDRLRWYPFMHLMPGTRQSDPILPSRTPSGQAHSSDIPTNVPMKIIRL